jgi:hypothetical protein
MANKTTSSPSPPLLARESTVRDASTICCDQSAGASPVPPTLRRLFERSASERSGPQPLDVFAPADWPPCPACGDRLLAAAVATDAHDDLVAAAMTCYNRDHGIRQYVYNVATDTVYGSQERP